MGKAKRLTDAEIQIIRSFNKQGDSNRQIASKIGRSETVIRNLLKKVINMELKKTRGNTKFTVRQKNQIR
jgi:transposase